MISNKTSITHIQRWKTFTTVWLSRWCSSSPRRQSAGLTTLSLSRLLSSFLRWSGTKNTHNSSINTIAHSWDTHWCMCLCQIYIRCRTFPGSLWLHWLTHPKMDIWQTWEWKLSCYVSWCRYSTEYDCKKRPWTPSHRLTTEDLLSARDRPNIGKPIRIPLEDRACSVCTPS